MGAIKALILEPNTTTTIVADAVIVAVVAAAEAAVLIVDSCVILTQCSHSICHESDII